MSSVKKVRNLLTLLLIISLALPAFFDGFGATTVSAAEEEEDISDFITAVVINTGEDETQINFTWYANTDEPGVVQIAEESDRTDIDGFPIVYDEYDVTEVTEVTHTDYTATHDSIYDGWYSNKATVTGLKPGVTYVYRVGNEDIFTEIETYQIYGDDEDFGFFYSGDPQLDNSKNTENTTVSQWKDSMEMITQLYPDTSLLVLGGDLANSGSEREYQYSQGLMAPEQLKHLAIATTVGNHDEFGDGNAYRLHFNQPNQTEIGAYRDVPGDYYYTYHNVLFIHLTTSNVQDINTSLGYVDSHVNFIREVLEENQDCDWHILVFHEAMFSQGTHSITINTRSMRSRLVPKLAELDQEYGIDLVLNAHDHSYGRTYTMQGLTPLVTETAESEIVNPDGIIYVTANTGSGVKYYEPQTIDYSYLAVRNQEYTPNISYIHIDTSAYEATLHMTTYRTCEGDYTGSEEAMSIVDEFTITKTADQKASVEAETDKNSETEVVPLQMFSSDDADISVSALTGGEEYDSLRNAAKSQNGAAAYYSIGALWNSGSIQPQNEMLVRVPLPELASGAYLTDANQLPTAKVYILSEDGVVSRLSSSKISVSENDGNYYVEFTGADFSDFAVVALSSEEYEAGRYSIRMETSGGGSVYVTDTAEEGEQIKVTLNADENYCVSQITCTANGSTVKTTKVSDGRYTFIMPAADVSLKVSFALITEDKDDGTTNTGTGHTSHVGKTFVVNGLKYKVTKDSDSGREVRVTGMTTKKSTLTIPAKVTNINWAESFKVTSVKAKIFKGSAITKAVIGKNVTKIGPNAFKGCTKLKTVTIGKSVKTIGIKAFYGCSKLKKVNIKSAVLRSVKKGAFKKISAKAVIKVPVGKKNAYTKKLKGKIAKGVTITK